MSITDIFSARRTLQTSKSPDQVIEIIKSNITTETMSGGNGKNDPFYGHIESQSYYFSVYKTYIGRNSFMAILDGKAEPWGTGSQIKLKIHPSWFVQFFIIMFISLAIYNLFNGKFTFQNHTSIPDELAMIFATLLPILAFSIFGAVYYYGAKTSLKTLCTILNAEIIGNKQNSDRFQR